MKRYAVKSRAVPVGQDMGEPMPSGLAGVGIGVVLGLTYWLLAAMTWRL